MDEKTKREFEQAQDTQKSIDEELSEVHSRHSGASLHTRVMEELMKQKQSEIQQQRSRVRSERVSSTEAAPRINISRSMTVILSTLGIMLVLIIGLIISQIQMNSKYQKIIESMSQQSVPASSSGMQQDTRIAALENKVAVVEEKVNTVIEQFDWGDISTSESSAASAGNISGTASGDGEYMEYNVQKGDTLWSLSVKFFGDGAKSDELMRINGFTGPNDLKSGQTILVPAKK